MSSVRTFDVGSPAHAGMDPAACQPAHRQRRLPRTRGDGPEWLTGIQDAAEAPPHTRGWTRAVDPYGRLECGSPAHAGMDPPRLGARGRHRWLPRTRGDGPTAGPAGEPSARAPPHTRGWTPLDMPPRAAASGSPAHAGMDPAQARARRSGSWLPRTRGDGPVAICGCTPIAEAPPHTRGMDPRSARPRRSACRLPRTRGDGPVMFACCVVRVTASPHTRGWTPARGAGLPRQRGFPAHAGMDPVEGSRAGGK